MSALNGALTLVAVHEVAVAIAENLNLDMPRGGQPLFEEHRVIAKRGAGFALGTFNRRHQFSFVFNNTHAAATATGRGFDQDRITNLRSRRDDICIGSDLYARQGGYTRFVHEPFGR